MRVSNDLLNITRSFAVEVRKVLERVRQSADVKRKASRVSNKRIFMGGQVGISPLPKGDEIRKALARILPPADATPTGRAVAARLLQEKEQHRRG